MRNMRAPAPKLNETKGAMSRRLVPVTVMQARDVRSKDAATLESARQPESWRPALFSELGIQRDGVVLLAPGAQGHEAPLFWERV